MTSLDINHANQASIKLNAVNSALGKIGIAPFPGPDLTSLPDVSEPTRDEIRTAILNAKGDVGKSAEVQALAARAWLASTGAARSLEYGARVDAWHAAKEAIPAISEDIRDRYAETAERLREAAQGPFRGTRDLATLDLANLKGDHARAAGEVIADNQDAVALHRAWHQLWAAHGEGTPFKFVHLANPTPGEYLAHMATTATIWPSTPYEVAVLGWEGSLPSSFKGAGERHAILRAALANAKEQEQMTARRRGLAGSGVVML